MTAAHPTPPIAPGADQRGQEPSMEEILASIRRIIADDQSLPGHSAFREPSGLRGPVDEPAPSVEPEPPQHSPIHILHPEPPAVSRDVPHAAEPVEEEVPEPAATVPQAHGQIAAPQFASPAGPIETMAAPAPRPAEPAPTPHIAPIPEPVVAYEAPRVASPMEPVDVVQRSEPDPEPEPEPEPFEYDAPIGFDAAPPTPDAPPALFSTATDHSVTSAFNMLAATRLADNSEELLAMTREMIRPILKTWLDDNLPSMVERLVRAEIERVSRGGR